MNKETLFIVEIGENKGGVETIVNNIEYYCDIIQIKTLKTCFNQFSKIQITNYKKIVLNQPYSAFLFILFFNLKLIRLKKYYVIHINFSKGKYLRRFLKKFFFFLLRITSFKLIFFSEKMSKEFHQKKIKITPPCLSKNNLKGIKSKKWGLKEIDFVFVGRLEYQKGADGLQKIANGIASSGFKLNIVGNGSINDFEGNNNIIYHGEKNIREVYQILNNSKVLIFPSRFEGFGIVIVEALFFGCKVVSYDCDFEPSDILNVFKTNLSLVESEAIDQFINTCLLTIKEKPKAIKKEKFENYYGNKFISQLE